MSFNYCGGAEKAGAFWRGHRTKLLRTLLDFNLWAMIGWAIAHLACYEIPIPKNNSLLFFLKLQVLLFTLFAVSYFASKLCESNAHPNAPKSMSGGGGTAGFGNAEPAKGAQRDSVGGGRE